MERLYMTQPYYSVDNYFYVRTDSTYEAPAELSGRTIGVCASCSHEYYLKGELVIPGVEIVQLVEDPEIVPYEIETAGLQELADGGIEAFLCAGVTGQQAIDDGLALRALEPSAFVYYPSGFVDRSSGYDPVAFLERVDAIISAAHADGTLRDLSIEYFGTDLAAKAAAFDLHSIGQVVP
jgi:ABC-type amino acid transport substrate-binding protein